MDTKDFDKKRINYIFGDLSKEEEDSYKEQLKRNPDMAEEVELKKRIIAQVKLDKQLEEILNDPGYEWAEAEAEKAVKEFNKRKRREYVFSHQFIHNYILPIAAAIMILIVLSNVLTFIISPETTFQKFYKDYTTAYYAEATVNEAQILLTRSLNEYNEGNYSVVTENMRTLMENGELNVRGQIVLAFYDAWKPKLLRNIDPEETKQEDALWYLAVTSLKLENYKRAQILLREFSAKYDRRGNKAARLDTKISKILSDE